MSFVGCNLWSCQEKWLGSMVKGANSALHHGDQAMSSSIVLQPDERKSLLHSYRHAADPALHLRAHLILLLADGYTWAAIADLCYCSTRTIARWQGRFQQGRVPALLGLAARRPGLLHGWIAVLVGWVTQCTPRAFGFLRSRWCCEVVVLLLWRIHQEDVSRETVRRWLHRANIVWRRPRPVLARRDPNYAAKVASLRSLLLHPPEEETVVFQDEVDINLNPKIGCMWMFKGQQAKVVTPGDNKKCYLAGPPMQRTGQITLLVVSRRHHLGLLALEHPHTANLGIQVDVHLILEHHRLLLGRMQQQRPQAGHLGRVVGITARQNGTRSTPDDVGAVQPAAHGLAADILLMDAPQQQDDDLAAPAAAQEAKGAGGALCDPTNQDSDPAVQQARSACGQAQQGGNTALLEAALPAGDGAGAAIAEVGDGGPGVAVGQQEDEVGAQVEGRIGSMTVGVQEALAFVGLQHDTGRHGLVSVVKGRVSTFHHRAKPFLLTRPEVTADETHAKLLSPRWGAI